MRNKIAGLAVAAWCAGVSAAQAATEIWLVGAHQLASPASVETVISGESVGVCGAMNV